MDTKKKKKKRNNSHFQGEDRQREWQCEQASDGGQKAAGSNPKWSRWRTQQADAQAAPKLDGKQRRAAGRDRQPCRASVMSSSTGFVCGQAEERGRERRRRRQPSMLWNGDEDDEQEPAAIFLSDDERKRNEGRPIKGK